MPEEKCEKCEQLKSELFEIAQKLTGNTISKKDVIIKLMELSKSES